MQELLSSERHMIEEMFRTCSDSVVWSYLQGYMGRGFVDDIENPACGMIIGGDFCFLAGDAECGNADDLIMYEPDGIDVFTLVYVGGSEAWSKRIEQLGAFSKRTRYGIKKEGDVFDRELLEGLADGLASGYVITAIDKLWYEECMREPWSRDLCGNFNSVEDFMERGLGFAILYNGEIVAGASSYSAYDGGIEVEIITSEDHRRKGLATVCGAKLVLESVKQGKYPCWDAANMNSVAIAERLGYHYGGEYTVWVRQRFV